MKLKKYDISVIVGRFQIDNLHSAHIKLINEIVNQTSKNIIFLGVSATLGTKNNPLDFATRRLMIKEKYPDVIILPLLDCYSDKIWANNLDKKIREVFPTGTVCLYGGRDSFIQNYAPHGLFDTFEFPAQNHEPATEIRNRIGSTISSATSFRTGVIYSTQNQYPRTHLTVDVAILRKDRNNNVEVLLGKKPNEDKLRFCGGFVDQNESLEEAAKREAIEETNLALEGKMHYICSIPMEDWRYKNSGDTMLTTFFVASRSWGYDKAGDDLESLTWVQLDTFEPNSLMPLHIPLFKKLKEYINNGGKYE